MGKITLTEDHKFRRIPPMRPTAAHVKECSVDLIAWAWARLMQRIGEAGSTLRIWTAEAGVTYEWPHETR